MAFMQATSKFSAADFKPGDRLVYVDDEFPYDEHAATVCEQPLCNFRFLEVRPDDIDDDRPWIHENLVVRRMV